MKLNPPGRAADATICGRPLAAALVALPDLAHDGLRDVIGLCRLNRRLGTRLIGYTLSPGRITHDSAQPLSQDLDFARPWHGMRKCITCLRKQGFELALHRQVFAQERFGKYLCLHLWRVDEVAGPDRNEVTISCLSTVTRSEPQAKEASHEPCCDRSRLQAIADLHPSARRHGSGGTANRDVHRAGLFAEPATEPDHRGD